MEEHFISYSCIFISYIQWFEVSFQKSGYFSKKLFFPEFQLIKYNFRSIKIFLKNFSKPLPGSIDRTCFSINRTSWIKFFFFFFKQCFDSFKTLFQIFFKLSSLSPTWQGSTEDFLSFSTKFLQGFPLTRPVRPLYPFFCFYFHDFWNFSNLGFLLNQSSFSEIDHWVLLLYCYIHDICWLIWSIWGFVKSWKF